MQTKRRALIASLPAIAVAPAWAVAAREAFTADLMPAFWAAYDATRQAAAQERAEGLMAAFFEPNRPLYHRAGVSQLTARRVAGWLKAFDPIAADTRKLHRRMLQEFPRHVAAFRAALPDFDAAASPVYLLPSLLGFDGHLEPESRWLPLFLGPDAIVRFHGVAADLGVLMSHEIYHCYQGQKNPALALDPNPPIYGTLWVEGTATLASERLNPTASALNVLLDDQALLRDGPATLPRVAAALLQHLDATDEERAAKFFSMGDHGDWPARAGYYVGLQAMRRIGQGQSLQALAAMPAPQVRSALARELAALARPA